MEVQYLCELSKSLPCGLVAGKSLMLMAIEVDNPFRSPNGRTVVDFSFARDTSAVGNGKQRKARSADIEPHDYWGRPVS